MGGSAPGPIEIPGWVPAAGPLREWLEWLAELRRCAGGHALGKISERAENRGTPVSKTSIRRVLQGETFVEATTEAVAWTLAEMDRRPTRRSTDAQWTEFDRTLIAMRTAAAIEASSLRRASQLPPKEVAGWSQHPVRNPAETETKTERGGISGRVLTQQQVLDHDVPLNTLSLTVAARGSASADAYDMPSIRRLDSFIANGRKVPARWVEVPSDGLPDFAKLRDFPGGAFDVMFVKYVGFEVRTPSDRHGAYIAGWPIRNFLDALPYFSWGFIFIDRADLPYPVAEQLVQEFMMRGVQRLILVTVEGVGANFLSELTERFREVVPDREEAKFLGFDLLRIAAEKLAKQTPDAAAYWAQKLDA